MTIVLIIVGVIVFILLLLIFFHSIKICEGGKILQGCGKLLFPWSKKYKIPGFNSYCCEECYKRDLNLFSIDENPKLNIKFTEKEEKHGLSRDPYDKRKQK